MPENRWQAKQLLAEPLLLANSLEQRNLSFGYTKQVLWLYFEIAQAAQQPLFLELGATFLDRVELYYLDQEGELVQQVTGDHIPFFERPVLGRSLVLRLPIADEPLIQAYLIRVQTGSTLTLRPVLLSAADLLLQEKNSTLLYGILFGLSLMATLLAIFSFAVTRQQAFLTAAGYSLTFCWFHFTINGFDQQYFYPQNTVITDQLIGVGGFLSGALLTLLVQSFVPLRQHFPRINRFFDLWVGLYLLGAFASGLGGYPFLAPVLMLSGAAQMVLLVLMMCWAMRVVRPVPLLLLCMIAPGCFAILLQALRNLGLLPFNFWTSHLWAFSAMLQVSFLMLVLLVSLSRQQRELQQQLEHNSALQRFYQLMAHELRTPLAVVSSALTNLQVQTQTLPEAQPRINRARMAVARLNNLVDNALAEDRLHLLEQGLQLEQVSLDDWLAELRQLCLLTDKHQLVIMKPDTDYRLNIDRQWLTLAVLNLLDNAVKYSPAGVITLAIAVNAIHWSIRVQDQGAGVAAADLPFLFERGFRAAKHKNVSGLGLGLYLVDLVVKAHEGHIKVQSAASGTQVEIVLPQIIN